MNTKRDDVDGQYWHKKYRKREVRLLTIISIIILTITLISPYVIYKNLDFKQNFLSLILFILLIIIFLIFFTYPLFAWYNLKRNIKKEFGIKINEKGIYILHRKKSGNIMK